MSQNNLFISLNLECFERLECLTFEYTAPSTKAMHCSKTLDLSFLTSKLPEDKMQICPLEHCPNVCYKMADKM